MFAFRARSAGVHARRTFDNAPPSTLSKGRSLARGERRGEKKGTLRDAWEPMPFRAWPTTQIP